MLLATFDRNAANSMLWPSPSHYVHGLPEAIPRVWIKLNLWLRLNFLRNFCHGVAIGQ